MKKVLYTFGILFTSSLSFGQIAITIEGQSTDISGQTHVINTTDDTEHVIDLLVQNQSSMSQDWIITRKRVNVTTPAWTDYLCWGIEGDQFGGTCYSSSLMATNPWTTPASLTVAPNLKGLLAIHIDPDLAANQYAHYRYYVGRTADTPDDSVDVIFNQTASIKKTSTNAILSVYPNPSNDFLQVDLNGGTEATIKITDVLGNLVYEEKMLASKKVNIADFKNGVYMVTVLTSNGLRTTKRIVVKH